MEKRKIEIFKPIIGYEHNYEISNLGRVRNINTNKYIKINTGKVGYKVVNLWKNNEYKTKYIHRLIAIYFIPNINEHKQINHIDGDKLNNNIENLEWCSQKDNVQHGYTTGLTSIGENRKSSKLTNKQALEILTVALKRYIVIYKYKRSKK